MVPILAFADSAKALVANVSDDIQRVRTLWYASMLITAAMMIVWVVLTPVFPTFAGALSSDEETVNCAVTAFAILFVPYVLLSFNVVSDSVFLRRRKDTVSCIPVTTYQWLRIPHRVSALHIRSMGGEL